MTKINIKKVQSKADMKLKNPPKTSDSKKSKKNKSKLKSVEKIETKTVVKGKIGLGSLVVVVLISVIFGTAAGAFGSGVAKYWVAKYIFQDKNADNVIEETKRVTLEENSAVIESVKKVSPAVVSIVSSSEIQGLFGQVVKQESGGTGFIITSDGMIMTNRHVVSDKEGKYTVLTHDGKNYEAKVISLDPSNDLAVIQIEADNLPVVSFGDSDKLQVGQKVIAIGNALGEYQNTVTSGVVSAIGRSIEAGDGNGTTERLENVVQTDAAINQGNSGGPLVNLDGQVVGVNTAMDQGGQLISFAIPGDVAKEAMESILENGRIVRPFLGVRYMAITKEISEINQLASDKGALVYSDNSRVLPVVPDSPADKAGLEKNDIITKVNDDEIDQDNSLSGLLQKYSPGTEIELSILRDGKEIKVKVKLEETEE